MHFLARSPTNWPWLPLSAASIPTPVSLIGTASSALAAPPLQAPIICTGHHLMCTTLAALTHTDSIHLHYRNTSPCPPAADTLPSALHMALPLSFLCGIACEGIPVTLVKMV